jgi:hypothetical protein
MMFNSISIERSHKVSYESSLTFGATLWSGHGGTKGNCADGDEDCDDWS